MDQPGPVDYDAELRFDRLPGLRLDLAAEDPHIHGLIFRSSPNLPVNAADTATPRSIPTASPVPGAGTGSGTAAKATCQRPARSIVTR